MEGTWFLSVLVTDQSVEKTLRVSGDLHIGGVMYKIVQSLAVTADWSDHGLWWPEKCMWLNKPKLTLTQYGVQAEAKLQFTPMHKTMRVQLPDLQLLHLKLDFSVSVYNAISQLCKELGLRYSEELSFLKPADKSKDKDKKALGTISTDGSSQSFKRSSRASSSSNGSLNKGSSPTSPYGTPQRTPVRVPSLSSTLLRSAHTPGSPGSPGSWVNGMSPSALTKSLSFDESLYNQLANSPRTPSKEAFLYLNKYKHLVDKAAFHGGWLDSNKSLMEQGITDSDQLYLKYKYFSFYDLNPKYDPVRINQLYEQAKWSLISEELDCTEQEMMMFAALQLQIELQASSSSSSSQDVVDSSRHEEQDEIDAALNDLQVSLEGSSANNTGDITQVPELQEYIKHFKPKKYTMKGAKRYYAVLRDTVIYFHKSKDDINQNSIHRVMLKDCDIQPDVNLSSDKFVIKLYLPTSDGLVEEWLKCESEDQYARWMAACKLGSKGHTMADSSFNAEVKNIEQFLSLQKPGGPVSSVARSVSVSEESVDPSNYVAPRYAKKSKTKVTQRIIEAHANVKDMNLMEAKLNYIKAWQALPEYGLTYFLVKFRNNKREEVVGIGFNRLVRMNPKTAEVTRTYRFSTMSSWSVHWENQEVIVDFEEEKLAIKPLSASCKVFHEFIGGYIFLSMRSHDKTQALNEDMFMKLTSGTCA